jgi:hypothetical protein
MIDNKEQIEKLLTFEKEHDFYFLQVIQRKKDHPEGTVVGSNNSSRLIKGYYIYSLEQLNNYYKEITMLCELFEARACINLNKRNATDVSLRMLARLADNIRNGHPEISAALFNTVCGETHSETDKKWIVDIDYALNDDDYFNLVDFLHDLEPLGNKVITSIPSKSGSHIITKPFNLEKFKKVYGHDVHKNNPTNLYIP